MQSLLLALGTEVGFIRRKVVLQSLFAAVRQCCIVRLDLASRCSRFVLCCLSREEGKAQGRKSDILRFSEPACDILRFSGALERTRTSDARFRKPTLYPLSYKGA